MGKSKGTGPGPKGRDSKERIEPRLVRGVAAEPVRAIAGPVQPAASPHSGDDELHPRLRAILLAARYYGMELDPADFPDIARPAAPSAASLSLWAQNAGLWSRAIRLSWRHLLHLRDSGPVVLLFNDGGAALFVGVNAERGVVLVKDPTAPEGEPPVAVDEMRLAKAWSGEAILLRAGRGKAEADIPFSLAWLAHLVLGERRLLRNIGLASLTISLLTIIPPLLVMVVVNKVLIYQSYSTLALLSIMLAIFVVYETVLGHARRLIVITVSARIDAKLNLHIFNRLVRLSLDYFERHPAGETMSRVNHV